MARKKKYSVILSDDELKQLKSVIQKKNTSRTIKCRCQILIDLDEAHGKAMTHEQSATSNGICIATVSNTVKQYFHEGLISVITLKRNVNSDNAKRKLGGRSETRIIEFACSPAPEGHSRWTLRLLEKECRIRLEEPVSKDTIGRSLKKTAFDLTKTTTGASLPKKMQSS